MWRSCAGCRVSWWGIRKAAWRKRPYGECWRAGSGGEGWATLRASGGQKEEERSCLGSRRVGSEERERAPRGGRGHTGGQ